MELWLKTARATYDGFYEPKIAFAQTAIRTTLRKQQNGQPKIGDHATKWATMQRVLWLFGGNYNRALALPEKCCAPRSDRKSRRYSDAFTRLTKDLIPPVSRRIVHAFNTRLVFLFRLPLLCSCLKRVCTPPTHSPSPMGESTPIHSRRNPTLCHKHAMSSS